MFKEFIKWSDVIQLYIGVSLCWLYALDGQQGVTFIIGFVFISNFTNHLCHRISSARIDLISDVTVFLTKEIKGIK